MSYDLQLRCMVCGSIISDDNPDGIGFGCRSHVVLPARTAAAKEILPDFALRQWIFKVNIYKNEFLKVFEGRKFRSQFKKSFYESVKNSEKVSKKQLEVIKNMLQWEVSLSEIEKDLDIQEKNLYFELIEEAKKDARWDEVFRKYFDMFKKQYLSGKSKKEIEE